MQKLLENNNISIHHMGFLVKNIEEAKLKFEYLGYMEEIPKKYIPERKQYTLFMRHCSNNEKIELIEIEDETSVAYGILKKSGVGIYHICYEVEDFYSFVADLRKQGFIPITKEEQGLENQKIQFFYNTQVGIIEVAEKRYINLKKVMMYE